MVRCQVCGLGKDACEARLRVDRWQLERHAMWAEREQAAARKERCPCPACTLQALRREGAVVLGLDRGMGDRAVVVVVKRAPAPHVSVPVPGPEVEQ